MFISLSDMATSSNERREQTIIRLRQLFRQKKVVTVTSAMKTLAVTETTALRYCRDGDIPLWNVKTKSSVVPITDKNRPSWL